MLLLALLIAAPAANLHELPGEVPAGAARYTVLIAGSPAGQQAVWSEGGKLRAFFQYNDRGRGPKTWTTLAVRDGVLVSEETTGNDYMKNPVQETFSIAQGTASWKSCGTAWMRPAPATTSGRGKRKSKRRCPQKGPNSRSASASTRNL